MKNADCTVLVCSCDCYADILPPFAGLLHRFWPDCPFETVLSTETDPGVPGFDRVVAAGAGKPWCQRLLFALDRIETPYVLMLCDDYFVSGEVDTRRILSRLSQMREFGAANLRLVPNPRPTAANSVPFSGAPGLARYKPLSAYSIATQTGIWDREFLKGLADGKSTIWELERRGSFDPITSDKTLLVTLEREFPFVDAVHKGHWERAALELCRENGIDTGCSPRTLPPLGARVVEGLKKAVFSVFPWNWIVRVQNALG